jgi:hypothetical protein
MSDTSTSQPVASSQDRAYEATVSQTSEAQLPSVDELLAEFDDTTPEEQENRWEDELEFDREFAVRAVEAERAWVHLRGLEDHYSHKKAWSYALMGLLGGMVCFQWALLVFVGLGYWDFTKYEWLLPILLVQNLGQIIGLAFVVVKSLFKGNRPVGTACLMAW